MIGNMSWDQLQEWIEYRRHNPFGDQREDLRTAIITSNVVNALLQVQHSIYQSQSKKRLQQPKMLKPSDFMPNFSKESKERKPMTSKTEFREFMSMMREVYTT